MNLSDVKVGFETYTKCSGIIKKVQTRIKCISWFQDIVLVVN